MKKDELLKLVAELTAKNTALEEDFKVVKKLYHQQVDEIYKLELEIIKLKTSLRTTVEDLDWALGKEQDK